MTFLDDADELDKVFRTGFTARMPLGMLREILANSPTQCAGARFLRDYWDMPEDLIVELHDDAIRVCNVQ